MLPLRLGDQVRVVVGSSVGAVSGAYLAANWDRPPDEVLATMCELWRGLGFRDVIRRSPLPGGVWRLRAGGGERGRCERW